ncbi:MAG: metallophosphoesterase [Clostridia bacterium]|nr:metallophosphoesterase [Clostridia bacterium]
MSIFAIGDTHLSFSCDKPMDIFGGWQDYVSRLEKNWRAVVTDADTVVIPGDISWAMSLEEAERDFAFLDSLPGEKLIMKGNHDYWWSTKKKMDKFFQEKGFTTLKILHNNAYKVGDFVLCGSRGWFYDAQTGNDKKVIAREAGRIEMSLTEAEKFEGEVICFLHYPPVMGAEKCEEIMNVLIKHNVSRCYFGHLHGNFSSFVNNAVVDGVKFSLISADFLEFCPKLVEKI